MYLILITSIRPCCFFGDANLVDIGKLLVALFAAMPGVSRELHPNTTP